MSQHANYSIKVDQFEGPFDLLLFFIERDEMDIYGLALLTEEDKKFFDNLTEDDFPLTHDVGFNQSIEYTKLDRFHSCYRWNSILPSQYETLKRFISEEYGHFFYPDLEEDDNYDS